MASEIEKQNLTAYLRMFNATNMQNYANRKYLTKLNFSLDPLFFISLLDPNL